MKGKHHISEDYFIPEGLEFRDEYLQTAMGMYKRERRRALWLKRSIIAGIIALLITVSLFWLTRDSVENQASHLQEKVASASQRENGKKKSIQSSDNEKAIDGSDINKTSLSPKDGNEMDTNEKREAYNSTINSKKTAFNAEADGQGGSLSSGSELPDPRPSKMEVKSLKENRNSEGETTLQNINSIEPVLSNSSSVYSDSQTIDQGDNSMISRSYLTMQSIVPKALSVNAQSKQKAETRPLDIPTQRKFKPYLVLGFNPLSDYGSGWNRFKIDPYIALGVDHRLGNGWRVGADARYYFISGLSHPLTFEQTTYGQGFETNQTTIYTDRLHYAGMHLTAQKKFGKHQASLGYGADYLVTGRNSIENRLYSSFENVSGNASSTSGYVLGFRNFNHSISLGYDYWMGKNKAIGLNYQLGLTDVSANKYFTQGQFDRNSMLSVHLKMYLR